MLCLKRCNLAVSKDTAQVDVFIIDMRLDGFVS